MPLGHVLLGIGGCTAILASKHIHSEAEEARVLVRLLHLDRVKF